MFNIRALTENDYPELCKWWKFFRFSAPQKEYLPNDGLGGIMVTKDGIDICAGFLYFTNSKLSWLEFIVSNPDYRESDRKDAIVFLISELTEIAKRKGFSAVFTSVKHQGLIKHYEACGYSKGSNNTTEMIIKL
jgi:hypothetical protein